MKCRKATRPATAAAVNGPCAKFSAGQLEDREASLTRLQFQAARLAVRFGLTKPHAETVALLCFGEGERA